VFDTRRHRTDIGAVEPTMLGNIQLAAFHKWLSHVNGTSIFKFIITSVPFTSLWTGDAQIDSWAGYPSEKQVLLDAMHSVPNVVLLSGDRHEFAAIEYSSPDKNHYPVYEISTSPLNMFYIPFVRTLQMRSNASFEKTRTIINDSTFEVSHVVEEIPRERVIKYIPEGNHKWAAFEVNTKDEPPTLTLEVMIDGKSCHDFKVVGTPIKLQSSTALTFIPDGVKDMFNKLGFSPSKWF